MAKSKNWRMLELMERIHWKGVDNWLQLREEHQTKEIPAFRDWLTRHIHFIDNEDAQQAVRDYYLVGDSAKPGTGFYIRKDRGTEALIAVYTYQQEKEHE